MLLGYNWNTGIMYDSMNSYFLYFRQSIKHEIAQIHMKCKKGGHAQHCLLFFCKFLFVSVMAKGACCTY